MAEPSSEPMRLPPEYGTASSAVSWQDVQRRLTGAMHYWLATTRPDGRPHVVPLDGLWLRDVWHFGGSVETVRHRNLETDARAALHLEGAESVVIVEGHCEFFEPTAELAEELSDASGKKYGSTPGADAYMAGLWRLVPAKALAWTSLALDPTRFLFG